MYVRVYSQLLHKINFHGVLTLKFTYNLNHTLKIIFHKTFKVNLFNKKSNMVNKKLNLYYHCNSIKSYFGLKFLFIIFEINTMIKIRFYAFN